jgi:hypothetical protein
VLDAADLSVMKRGCIKLKKSGEGSSARWYADMWRQAPIRKRIGSVARLVMNAPKEMRVEHINNDALDNRRCNLRLRAKAESQENSGTRLCGKCKEMLPVDRFNAWKCKTTGKTMLPSFCKTCKAEFQREWKRLNPDRVKKWKKDYYARHRDKNTAESIAKLSKRLQESAEREEIARQELVMIDLGRAIAYIKSRIIPQNEAARQGKVFCCECKKIGDPPLKWSKSIRAIKCRSCINKSFAAFAKRLTREDKLRHRKRIYEAIMSDPLKHLRKKLRERIYVALKRAGHSERSGLSKMRYLGCTPKDLRSYLERMFKRGMSWDNMGEWHVDHVYPIASFDLSNEEGRRKAFHYTNLQPLWAKDNARKGDTIPKRHHQPLLMM